ncbi:MAG: SusC/RagA family TonB-linked outer membrane protein [Bacteroidia bacterium]|jgi:TonB-linked SusC/RagA family outer membrane protein|nr:SusC/RagA family TonB-linked outer membrane protein [Bacteroidia bacterium]
MRKTLLLTIFMVLACLSKAQTIKGKVTDEKGEAIVGASIFIEGTQKGGQTDVNGFYLVNDVSPGKYKVRFTFIGLKTEYKAIEISAGQTLELNVKMIDDPQSLDEAVVVGYGTIKRREITSAVSKISNRELNDLPVQSFEQALQGKLAGVAVTQGSGLAGSPSIIRIRGISSISAGGDPLYVVDGIPITQDYGAYGNSGGANFNPLATINPFDIESVEVLKDAAATSIYGSRGANGVIVITTKRAEKGKMRVNFSTQFGLSTPTARPNLVGRDELLNLMEEAWINDGNVGKPDLSRFGISNMTWDETRQHNTDWYKELTQVGLKTQNDLTISKAWNKFSLYSSLSYGYNETFVRGNSFNRVGTRINGDYKINNKIKIQFGTSFNRGINNRVFSGWSGGYGLLMSSALPFYPVRNPDGSYFLFNNSDASFRTNPVMMLDLYKWQTVENRSISNLAVEYEVIKNLKLRVQGNYDYQSIGDDSYAPAELNKTTGSDTTGTAARGASYTRNYNYTAQLTYKYNINKYNKFEAVGGYERQQSLTNGFFMFERFAEDLIRNNEKSGSRVKDYGVPSEWRFERIFGRVNYNLLERYYAQIAFSYDGSSRFGSNYSYGFFPAVSAGWVISEESFLRGNKKISFLKLRASYGRSGNSDFDPNARFGFFRRTNLLAYNGQSILYPTKLENENLRWETSWTANIGLDFGFFDDRITGSIDVYDKRTSDVIMNLNTDPSVGFSNYFDNVGGIRNYGAEMVIKSSNIQKGKFRWTTTFVIARNFNEITSTGDYTEEAVSGGTNDTRVVVGSPVGTYYLVRFSRVDPESGRPIYLDKDGNETFEWKPANRVPVGNILPKAVGGITNTFRYKNWDLSVLFNFQIGGNIYDASAKRQLGVMSFWNSRAEVADRWQKPGDVAAFPRLTLNPSTYGLPDYWQYNTPMFLYDASFIRLRNLTLGYMLPNSVAKKFKATSCRVAVICTNLFVLTKYPGLDPEIARDGEGNINQSRNMQAQGTYYLNAPQERTYNIQILATF